MTMLTTILVAACVTLQAPDAKETARKAILRMRSQTSYEATFKANLKIPGSAPLDYEGRSVWVAPDVLYIHYTATGGKEDNVVRAGSRRAWACHDESEEAGPCPRCKRPRVQVEIPNIWTYSRAAGWLTAEEAQKPALGRGIQNPDAILAVVSRHLDTARFTTPDVVEVALTGKDIQEVLREHAPTAAFDWAKSSATLKLHLVDGDRISRLSCSADLASTDPKVGVSTYSADISMVSWNDVMEMTFLDDAKKPIALDAPIKKAIAATLKSGK